MKSIIKKLAKIFNPLPLATVLCFGFATLIYFFGKKFGARGIYPFRAPDVQYWSSLALLILGLVLLAILIIRWIIRLRASRATKEKREPTIEELESKAMDQVFEKAVSVIRNRWSGRGRRIYGLPWYMVIGKQGAGKSSLIENGDMRFPIDHELRAEISAIGSFEALEFVDWRVSGNEAVLLDMAGEFFIPHEDRTSVQKVIWDRFLTNLQSARPRRPLNGVVLAIDLLEFSGYSQSEREQYANLVRRTIDDLVERLGTRLTIHVALTKLDQLAGFGDFFESLTAADRENLFGFHFLYEGTHTPQWPEQLQSQYDDFLIVLERFIRRRLLTLKTTRSRQEAYTFYREFVGIRAPLDAFIANALAPDKFSTPPLVRGLYFVSNTQENAPRNVFLEAVGQRYALPAPLYGTSQGANFPFFVTKFFKKAVFPEAGLAGNNLRVEKRYRRSIGLVSCLGLLACLGGGLYWSSKFNENLQQAEAVLNKTRAFNSLETSARFDPTGKAMLNHLNTIRDATFEFGDYRTVSATQAQLTLYQGDKIGPIADKAYRSLLNHKFAPQLVTGVGEKLRNTCPKGSDAELEYLRVYRMLGDMGGRDNRVVNKYFADIWQVEFEGQAEIQDQLDGHLNYMLDAVPASYELDENLVIDAQNNLGRLTPFRRVYSSLRADAGRQLPNPIELSTTIGASFGLVYQARTVGEQEQATAPAVAKGDDACGLVTDKVLERGPFEIPRLFTATQFRDFFIPQNEQVAQVAARDLWVLGQLNTTDYSEPDYARIREKVRELYVDEYMRVWRQTLNTLEVRDFKDIRDATEILRALSGSENPIRRTAQLVTEHTTIYEPEAVPLEGTEAVATDLPLDPNKRAASEIYDAFGEIRRMLEDKADGGQPTIVQIEAALTALYDYMKVIRDAPSPDGKALEAAIKRAQLTGEDPIYVLQRIAERAPAPFDGHLRHVADEAWRIVMIGATEELNRKWHEEIYGDYQRLIAGKYPFNRASELDLPVQDFEEFFKPGGILESFYNKELLIFVNETNGEPRTIDGRSLALDPDFAGNLRKAIDITKSFFDASGELGVEFKVQTIGMSANLSRAVLNFEGQLVINSHGPAKTISIVWPNLIDQPSSSRVDIAPLFGNGKASSLQYNGPWSWLRLYDAATKGNFQNNSVDISFATQNGQISTFRIRPEARVNPFFNSPLSEFSLPSHLRSEGS